MKAIKIDNSIQDLSIADMFDSIDNVGNKNEDNDKIINNIKEKIETLLKNVLKKKNKKEKLIQNYKDFLCTFQELIEKQITTINNLIEEDTQDSSDIYLKLKKELFDYYMQIYKLDMFDVSEILNKEEKNIYRYICVYDFLNRQNDNLENHNLSLKFYNESTEKEHNQKDKDLVSPTWKIYFYLVICLEKQQQYNKSFISYYVNKNRDKDFEDIYKKFSDFYVADFQGQLSKNIYCQRKKLKLTQMQLSERSGIDRTMIAKIERVKQPTTLETAIKLLSSLNMGIAIYPFTEIEEESKQKKA